MRRIGWIVLLGIALAGCGARPATRPSMAALPPPTATSAPAEQVTVLANGIDIVVPGYVLSCVDPTLSIPAADGWKPLENYILESHYLDDTFKPVFGMCDVVVCSKVKVSPDNPIGIGFPLYEYVGERQHSWKKKAGVKTFTVPAYRTVRPSGMVKLDVPYYLDEACSQPRTYTTTLDLPN